MATINLDELDLSKTYTVKDYLSWQFEERVELLRSYIAKISPAPSSRHQVIARQLFQEINWFLKKKTCQIFCAPFDVYLTNINGEKDTIVQPDIYVICDISKIKKRGCFEPPELIIEILSPRNCEASPTKKEMKYKYDI
jgi:Uma2 family endonuclease